MQAAAGHPVEVDIWTVGLGGTRKTGVGAINPTGERLMKEGYEALRLAPEWGLGLGR